jgi:type I restriction enzyme, S subunit
MNAGRLLASYERIADAPDAIARVRRFTLDLAVRGKLVPQDPRDEPASELLKRIAAEIPAKKTVMSEREPFPFNVPEGWVWTHLGRLVARSDAGWSPKTEDHPRNGDEWGVLKVSAVSWDSFRASENKQVLPGTEPRLQAQVNRGDFLISRANTAELIARAVIVNEDPVKLMMSDKIVRLALSAYCDHKFVWIVNNYADFSRAHYVRHASGVSPSMKNVSRDVIMNLPVPLPPLAEQHRIVAKVDELMALCDRLEAARAEREATRDRLTAASFVRLNVPDPGSFHDDVRFALGALPALTTRPDQIKQLRQTILNLAVCGNLSPEGDWQAAPTRLGDLASLQNGYAFKSEWFSKSGTRLLRNANVGHGVINWDDEVRLPETHVPEYERFRLVEGDLVLSLDRPFIGTGTKVARIRAKDLPALLLQRVGRFVLSKALHPNYLFLWVKSPHFAEQIDPGRSNGVPHVSSRQVEEAVLFLPPLTEQRRIVAKVDELMALCDRLETSVAAGDEIRHRLLEALLAEALAPAKIVKSEEPERAAAHG